VKVLVALLTLALAAAALCQEDLMVTSLPESPHQSLYIEGMCTVCHSSNREGAMEPHVFVLPISEICLRESCHTVEKIGRSHPVGVDARKSRVVEDVPESFPLEEDMISCGSCHEPHGAWLAATQCYPKQQPAVFLAENVAGETRETPYYMTYYLRVPGDPIEGFTALCNSCHPR
jgi:hypothetical protein